jgi:gas vesicle protein
MADESRGLEFVTGFFLGAVVGAAAALLFAPSTGEETREQLRERGIEIKTRAGDTCVEAQQRAKDMADDAGQRAKEMADEAKRRATEAQERSRLALDEQKVRLQQAIDEGKQAATKRKEDLLARFEAERNKQAPTQPPTQGA